MKTWRSVGAALTSFLVFTTIVVLATQADGREATLAESNDGGAWLVDRDFGALAHVEYTTRQPTSSVQLGSPGSAITAHQSDGVIAVHDGTASTLRTVVGANALASSPIQLPSQAEVRAVPRGVAVFDSSSATVWSISTLELSGVTSVDDVPPTYQGFEEGRLVVGRDGRLVVLGDASATWISESDDGVDLLEVALPDGFQTEHATMAGDQLVLVDGDEWVVGTSDGFRSLELSAPVSVVALQQESSTWPIVAVLDDDGLAVRVDVSDGRVADPQDAGFDQRATARPILHDGCVHSLRGVDGDMNFAAQCADGVTEIRTGLAITDESRLRLVNGNVWIDALDGSGYLVTPDKTLEQIADFSQIFEDDEGDESADGDRVREEVNQGAEDAQLTEADSLDDDEENEAPIAEDDEAATRLGRPVLVDVLANDTDPDGDVILVTDAVLVSGDATVQVPTSANSVQVSPAITALDEPIVVTYSISDPAGLEDTATITVTALPDTQADNRPPEPALDRTTGTASATVSLNVLDNDRDPDGDSLALVSVDVTSGVTLLSQHPDGEIFLSLPPNSPEGEILLTYIVRDEHGDTAEGTIRIEMRIEETNTPPDARNDAGVTQVGRKITLDVLANDVDPDGDVLSIGSVARPVGVEIGDFVNTTDDGEFSFEPTTPGTFVFEYGVTDGVETDTAQIRIEVLAADERTAPVAVRDDVTLALDETQLVRAFENDGDRDGDLFDLFERTPNDNLAVVPVPGIGFRITLRPTADVIETFDYRLTDGNELSNFTTVVVVRSEEAFTDAAPIARDDNSRVRPGRTSIVPVTRNDFDPEGGPVTVISATTDELVVRPSGDGQAIEVEVPQGRQLGATVSYVIEDEAGNTAAANVDLTMVRDGEENAPPIARNDVFFTVEEQPIFLPVLLNDSDPENDPVSIASTPETPDGGVLELSEDGRRFAYQPIEGFVGTDTFSYVLVDTEGAASTATVRIGVMPIPVVNRPPIAVDDSFVFEAGAGDQVLDVLDNDSDPDGDALSIIDLTGPGSVVVDGDGLSVDVPPDLSEDQTVSFEYEISDGRGGTARAVGTVTLTANELPNVPPVATSDSFGPYREGETVLLGVVANDSDPDGEVADLRIVETGAGSVVGQQVEIVVPDADFEFSYTIADADDATDSTVVRVTVTENLPPVVTSPVNLGEFEHDPGNIEISLADYVSDPDGDELTFSGVNAISGGNTRLDVNTRDARNVTFIPSAGYVGEAVIVYNVDDGNDHSVSGRVVLTILPPENQPPEAIDGASISLEAGVDQTFDLSSLFTDPDPDDALTYDIVAEPGAGVSLAGPSGSTVTVSAPIDSPPGETSFTARATDGSGETAQATVVITLTESSVGPPIPASLSITVNQGESETIDVVATAVNPLGGALTVENVFASAGGTATASGSSITFAADGGFSGQTTITYDLSDGRESGGTATGSIDVTVLGRPDAPVGLQAEAVGPRSISLTWTAPVANGSAITGYEIDINGERLTVPPVPSYRFDDRTPGADYFVTVRAINDVGESDFSNQVGPITPDQIPGAPGVPSATFGDGAIDLTWAEAPNEGSAITTYHLEIAACSSFVQQTGTGTAYTWTGLTNGVECTFRVAAENAAGQGPWSGFSTGVCPVGVPQAPGQPTAERGDKEATITWAQPVNPDCEPILGYELRRSPGAQVTNVAAGTTTWTSSGLTNGETYSFEVRAENRAGFGPWSPPSGGVTPCGVPLAPTAPTADPGDTLAIVTRTGDAPANGCDVSQYQVSVNGGAGQDLAANGQVSSLTNGDSYTFRVRGINEIGEGEWSAPSNAVTPFGPPFAVASIAAVNSGGFTNWQWNKPDDNGNAISSWNISGGATQITGPGGNQLTVECRTTQGDHCRNVNAGTQPGGTPCLQTAQTVNITVAAVNDAGPGPSTSQSISIGGCPNAPGVTITNITTSGYTVNWNRPGGSQTIHVERDGTMGATRSGTSTTIAFTGSSDTIRVWACNEFGCSASGVQTVNQPQPQVSISWNERSSNQTGCSQGNCWTINYSYSDFAAGNHTARCHSTVDGFFGASWTVTGASGSGNTVGRCWTDPNVVETITIRIDGVVSNGID